MQIYGFNQTTANRQSGGKCALPIVLITPTKILSQTSPAASQGEAVDPMIYRLYQFLGSIIRMVA
jgi:hypothetical protein